MLKKRLAILLAVGMLASMATACGQPKAEGQDPATSADAGQSNEEEGLTGDDLAFMKFKEPVDVHIGQGVNPLDTTLPEGDTVDNNQYTRYLKENYNINIIADWTAASGSDYDQKVALCIASNSLPDGLATNRMYMLKAAKSDMLYDIGELFDKYASSQVKGVMETTEGRAAQEASYNGKMVSLVGIDVQVAGVSHLNIRKDWLDDYKLEVPKTMDDVEAVAKVFQEKKPAGDSTVPIAGPGKSARLYSNFLSSSGAGYGFDPIFSACDAYPGYWLTGEDGTVSYGSLDDKNKDALTRLASWYQQGLIDPEMGTRDDPAELLNSNQLGMYFGPWWMVGYGSGDSFRNDPEANWQCYPIYDDKGDWNVHMASTTSSYTIMNKKASPDAVKAMIIMANALLRDENTFDVSVELGWYPIRNLQAPLDECEYTYNELYKVLDGETKPEDYTKEVSSYKLLANDTSKVLNTIPGYKKGEELSISDFNMEDNFGDFMRQYSLMIGTRPWATTTPAKKVYSAVYSMTPTMETKWANLKKLEDETMLKIITGKTDIGAFDQFVTDWKAQGGDEITAEVQAEVTAQGN